MNDRIDEPVAKELAASLRSPCYVTAPLTARPEPIYVTTFPDQTDRIDADPHHLAATVAEEVPPGHSTECAATHTSTTPTSRTEWIRLASPAVT